MSRDFASATATDQGDPLEVGAVVLRPRQRASLVPAPDLDPAVASRQLHTDRGCMSNAMTLATACDTVSGFTGSSNIGDLVDLFGPTPTVLAVWAHPDDESYLGGGLIAEVSSRGGRIVNVTATLGEHGTQQPDLFPPHDLAAIRSEELTCSLRALGVTQHMILGYPDGGCDQVQTRTGARRVRTIVDDIEPDLILTFGEDGVTGHPDHRAVGRWVELALADRPHQIPMITTASGPAWHETLVEKMHQIGAFWPGYPERNAQGPVWTVLLDGERLEQKLTSLACHHSQIGPLKTAMGATGYRHLASIEAYRPANLAALSFLSDPLEPAAA